ncbi:MAG: GspH/FimT family pseudopilin [Sphingomonas sp.]
MTMISARRANCGVPSRTEKGFTLVELLMVITVLALLSGAVALALPDPRGRLVDDAARFAARVRSAHDGAIIEGRSVSVWVSANGYGFDQRAGGAWQPVSAKPLRVSRWATGVHAVVAEDQPRQRVIFDSTGLANQSLGVRLQRGEDAITVSIGAGGDVVLGG